jgi:hypothetical protein
VYVSIYVRVCHVFMCMRLCMCVYGTGRTFFGVCVCVCVGGRGVCAYVFMRVCVCRREGCVCLCVYACVCVRYRTDVLWGFGGNTVSKSRGTPERGMVRGRQGETESV